ncbi:unnamed protein product [Polarella glacialis]|uniref:Phosphoglycerate mutase (2,3-diphosphoglycerate-dependent) n=1 Tax=Polarella glacialis TaxID=89957 RepID=A0A813L296_POLGL|nr:unnamed protein product [Polarella glacialis]
MGACFGALLPQSCAPLWEIRGVLPKRLILIRHGESEGNVNRQIYETVPDNAVHLSKLGWDQGQRAGQVLFEIVGREPATWQDLFLCVRVFFFRILLQIYSRILAKQVLDASLRRRARSASTKVAFIASPYVRARETLNAIKKGGDFNMQFWHEDPRIREQDFGNFQDTAKLMSEFKERKGFGRFYYRHPEGGEAPSDVYDRVSGFIDSLYRSFVDHPADNYVIVTHGVTMRVFLMRWLKQSVDDFNNSENPDNCDFVVLERCLAGRKYKLKLAQVVKPLTDPPTVLSAMPLRSSGGQSRVIRDDPPPSQ